MQEPENEKIVRLETADPDARAHRSAILAAAFGLVGFSVLSYFLMFAAALLLHEALVGSGLDLSSQSEVEAFAREHAAEALLSAKKAAYVIKAAAALVTLLIALNLFRRADRHLAIAYFGGGYVVLVLLLGVPMEPLRGIGSAGVAAACLLFYAWLTWAKRRAAA